MQRLDSVDVLRALALIGMVICHYPVFLSSGAGADSMLYFFSNHLLGGDCGASWFVFLVGLSQVLSANKRNALQDKKNAGRVVTRGLVIFVVGLLFLFLIQGYEELWVWDILTFIGATTIILLFCRRVPSGALLLFCAAVIFITPWLRSLTDLASFYGGHFESVKWISDFLPNYIFDPARDYEGGTTFLENVLGFFLIGQFPLLPWIIFPVIGFVIGRRITQKVIDADSPFILIIGMLLVFMGLFTARAGSMQPAFPVDAGYIVPLSFYPLSFSMALFLLGVVLILYISLRRIYDFRQDADDPGLFLSYCRQISKYSLTIYVTHFALFFIPLRLILLATGKYYLRDAMSTPSAFALAVLLLILYYPLLKLWDKADGKYSFEWLLARMLSKSGRATAAR